MWAGARQGGQGCVRRVLTVGSTSHEFQGLPVDREGSTTVSRSRRPKEGCGEGVCRSIFASRRKTRSLSRQNPGIRSRSARLGPAKSARRRITWCHYSGGCSLSIAGEGGLTTTLDGGSKTCVRRSSFVFSREIGHGRTAVWMVLVAKQMRAGVGLDESGLHVGGPMSLMVLHLYRVSRITWSRGFFREPPGLCRAGVSRNRINFLELPLRCV